MESEKHAILSDKLPGITAVGMCSTSYSKVDKICEKFQLGGFCMALEKNIICSLVKSEGQHCQNISKLATGS